MAFSQGHLENVIVEAVPASAAAIAVDPSLAGTTTYRVFADLADGWEITGVYGEPGNEFYIRTSTTFYNFVDGVYAGRSAGTSMFNNLAGKLDSYVTIASFTGSRHGVRSSDDTDGVLDGYMAQSPANDAMSFTPGFESQLETTFGPEATGTSAISTSDGAFVDLTGYATTNFGNVIFLGQFTTSGAFSMDLNIQVRNALTGVGEKYTAGPATPTEINEYRFAALHYDNTPNALPIVNITSPVAGTYDVNTLLTLSATASDADGSIMGVEFYRNSESPANKIGDGVNASGTWTLASQWSVVSGVTSLLAVATDDDGGKTTSSVVMITGQVPSDPAPSVSITAPSAGSIAWSLTPLNITANASDVSPGTVTQVEFFAGAASLGVDAISPYSVQWTPSTEGSFAFTARATDNVGNQTTSAAVNVTVTNNAPSCQLTAPASGTLNPGSFTLTATASDPENLLARVDFFVGGNKVGEAATSPYTYNYTFALGSTTVYAVAVDQGGKTAQSATVNVNVVNAGDDFSIQDTDANCSGSEIFTVPVNAVASLSNVKGFDFIMKYDPSKVRPTGIVYLGSALYSNISHVASYLNSTDNDSVSVSIWFNGNAPANAYFAGAGRLIGIEFAKTAGFTPVDTAAFEIGTMLVSKTTSTYESNVDDGIFRTSADVIFEGLLKFWKNDAPMSYVSGANLVTKIYADVDVTMGAANFEEDVDSEGKYSVNTSGNKVYHKIERQIANTTSVQSIISGADAQLVARVLVNDATFKPSIYQMWAMDVNRDGKISAGDLSQIMQRSVLQYGEYRQVETYNDDVSLNRGPSKDWLFAKPSAMSGAMYRISAKYPADDLSGYSKQRVPLCDTVYRIDISSDACQSIKDESFNGIMLGDVDGSYASASPSPMLKSTASDKVVFDLSKAIYSEGSIEVPVYMVSSKDVTSVDFAVKLNEESLSYSAVEKNVKGLESADYFNTDDRILRFSSYSLNPINPSTRVATVKFNTQSSSISAADLKGVSATINGAEAQVAVIDEAVASEVSVDVFPIPARNVLNVVVSADAKVVLMDLGGRSIMMEEEVEANQKKELNLSGVASGMYILKAYNAGFTSVKKVVVEK
jgi:hypothetical protein